MPAFGERCLSRCGLQTATSSHTRSILVHIGSVAKGRFEGAIPGYGTSAIAARHQLPRTTIRPLMKLTSSRICVISSQSADFTAGVMNFVQVSRSLSACLEAVVDTVEVCKRMIAKRLEQ